MPVAAKMLVGAVEIRIKDLAEAFACGDAETLRLAIHDQRSFDERGLERGGGEDEVGHKRALSVEGRSEVEGEFVA